MLRNGSAAVIATCKGWSAYACLPAAYGTMSESLNWK